MRCKNSRPSTGSGSSARPARSSAAERFRSWSTVCTRTTSGRSWTTPECRCESGTTAPGRSIAGSASPPPCEPRSPSTTHCQRWTPSPPRSGIRSDSSRWADQMQMEKLYQEIILDHYRTPHHFGLRDPFDTEVHHVNPTCGDEVTLRVRLDPVDGSDDAVVGDISYDALGCSISQAST